MNAPFSIDIPGALYSYSCVSQANTFSISLTSWVLIFALLFAEAFYLSVPENYHYLNQSECIADKTINDADSFREVIVSYFSVLHALRMTNVIAFCVSGLNESSHELQIITAMLLQNDRDSMQSHWLPWDSRWESTAFIEEQSLYLLRVIYFLSYISRASGKLLKYLKPLFYHY